MYVLHFWPVVINQEKEKNKQKFQKMPRENLKEKLEGNELDLSLNNLTQVSVKELVKYHLILICGWGKIRFLLSFWMNNNVSNVYKDGRECLMQDTLLRKKIHSENSRIRFKTDLLLDWDYWNLDSADSCYCLILALISLIRIVRSLSFY